MTPARTHRMASGIAVAVAAAEALALMGYAISIAAVALTQGLSGPSEVSSPSGTAVEVVVFALFGLGAGAIAWGLARGSDWTTVPFAMTQLLALVVGIPMATGSAAVAGVGITVLAVAGLAALVVTRATAASAQGAPGEPPGPPRRATRAGGSPSV